MRKEIDRLQVQVQAKAEAEAKAKESKAKNGLDLDLEPFKSYLRSEGLRLTAEREVILKQVTNTDAHFDAEDLLVSLRQQDLNVSRATVYRTLPLMVKGGFLREVRAMDRNLRYEHINFDQHHDHMICLSCGRIVEFNDPIVERLQNHMCQQQKFTPRTHRLEIIGRCKECRQVR